MGWSPVPVAHVCNPSYFRGKDKERITVQSWPRQIVHETCLANNHHKTACGVAQVVETCPACTRP
jgi:hypothetical protein